MTRTINKSIVKKQNYLEVKLKEMIASDLSEKLRKAEMKFK